MSDDHAMDALRARARSGDPQAAEELGLDLLAASEPGSERFGEGLNWLERAVRAGRTSAQLARGYVYMQHPTLPHAPDEARKSFMQAARDGDPTAVERLADLFLAGYGVERDDARACALLRQLADYGFPGALCNLAYLLGEGLGCEPDEAEAATCVLRAAAQGHTLAFVLAAERYASGAGVPQEPMVAAAWLELAAARGFPGAETRWQHALHALDERSRGDARELAEALKVNLRELGDAVQRLTLPEEHPDYPAQFNALVERNYRRLAVRELDPDPEARGVDLRRRPARAFRPEVRAWRPRVFTVADFASVEECAHLIDLAQPMLRSTAEVRGAQRAIEVDAFDGDCAMFPVYLATPVMRNLTRRFALLLQVRETHFEPLSVLRYTVGHEYSPHVDYFDGARLERHRLSSDFGGQRLATALVHLLSPVSGGETRYPVADLSVRGEPGMASIHYNATPEGVGDDESLHHGLPVVEGEKWIARTAVREASLFDAFYRTL